MFRFTTRSVAVLFLSLTLLSTLAAPVLAKPADNGGPGNSGAAKMCQDDQWMTLARFEQRTVPFTNQDECVSYGAQGGTLVPLVVNPTSISISVGAPGPLEPLEGDYCPVTITLENGAEGQWVAVVAALSDNTQFRPILSEDLNTSFTGFMPVGTSIVGVTAYDFHTNVPVTVRSFPTAPCGS